MEPLKCTDSTVNGGPALDMTILAFVFILRPFPVMIGRFANLSLL